MIGLATQTGEISGLAGTAILTRIRYLWGCILRAGVPLNQVRDLLGHSTIALTEKYAQFAPGDLADAVAQLNESVAGYRPLGFRTTMYHG